MIYGGLDEAGIAFEGVAEALAVPGADLRLFGKPESFAKRRMGVAVATGADTNEARERAKRAASKRCVCTTWSGRTTESSARPVAAAVFLRPTCVFPRAVNVPRSM